MSVTRGRRQAWGGHIDMSTFQLQRIYDRLRKQSLRKKDAYEAAMYMWDDAVADAVFEDRCRFYGLVPDQGNDVAHMAYVRGVSDALKAVEAE